MDHFQKKTSENSKTSAQYIAEKGSNPKSFVFQMTLAFTSVLGFKIVYAIVIVIAITSVLAIKMVILKPKQALHE